jgi:KAP family P-loop domain
MAAESPPSAVVDPDLGIRITPDFLQLRELAILANEGDPEPASYSFTSALLAFLAAHDPTSQWFQQLLSGANITSPQAGTEIYQPALEHGGSAAEPIGVVAEGSVGPRPTNDPSRGMIMAELDGERTFVSLLPNGQPVAGAAAPRPEQAIRLFGTASGEMTGRIGQSSRIEGPAYTSGDIGALVVDAETNMAVGVVVAGDDHGAVYSPIQPILDALDVELIPELAGYVRDPKAREEIIAVNDQAEGEDRLGIQQYVDAFAKLIKDAKPPLTIGIYGAWGSGKSFLINKIRTELAKPTDEANTARPAEPPVIVWFEAWDYNASDKLWAGLVERIFREFEASGRGWYGRSRRNLRRNFERQWRDLRPRLLPYMLFVIVIAVLTIGLTLANQDTWATTLGGSGVLVLLLGFVQVMINVLTTPASQRIVELFASSNYTAELGFMKQIKDDLEVFANSLKPHVKVVVFIDDLDRCDPKKAVEVLEAVKLLLDFDRFIVFLALDARIITQVIEEHYGKVLAEAQITGYEYLDKIVQIPFCMPEAHPEDLRNYLGSLVDMARDDIPPLPLAAPAATQGAAGGAGGEFIAQPLTPQIGGAQTRPTDGETAPSNNTAPEADEHAPQTEQPAASESLATQRQIVEVSFTPAERLAWLAFYMHLDTNPRRLKRLINIYRLVRALIANRPAPGAAGAAADPLDDLYRVMGWLILCEQWPYAAHVMLDLLDRSRKAAEAAPDTQALKTWQACPSMKLHTAAQQHIAGEGDRTLRKLDLPYDRLDSFFQAHLANLTLEDVRRLRPFTVNFNPVLSAEVRLTLSSAARE